MDGFFEDIDVWFFDGGHVGCFSVKFMGFVDNEECFFEGVLSAVDIDHFFVDVIFLL